MLSSCVASAKIESVHLFSAAPLHACAFFQYMLKQIGSDETLKFQSGFVVSVDRKQMLNVCSRLKITFPNPRALSELEIVESFEK